MPPVKSIEDQIAEMLKSSIADDAVDETLKSEAERLKGMIQKYIDEYYASYKPRVYHRRNGLKNGLRIDTEVKNRSISIYFDDNTVWGESYQTHDKPFGFEPILIDAGWLVHSRTPKQYKSTRDPVYRYDYYEGYHFLQSALDEFEKDNPYGLHIEIIINPRASSDFSDGFKLRSDHQDMYDQMGF